MAVARGTGFDAKVRIPDWRQRLARMTDQPGQRRNLGRQAAVEGGHGPGRSFHLDAHTLGRVADKAGQFQFPGQPVDKGAKPHALDLAGHHMATSGTR
jgi:hypothetical protein